MVRRLSTLILGGALREHRARRAQPALQALSAGGEARTHDCGPGASSSAQKLAAYRDAAGQWRSCLPTKRDRHRVPERQRQSREDLSKPQSGAVVSPDHGRLSASGTRRSGGSRASTRSPIAG